MTCYLLFMPLTPIWHKNYIDSFLKIKVRTLKIEMKLEKSL